MVVVEKEEEEDLFCIPVLSVLGLASESFVLVCRRSVLVSPSDSFILLRSGQKCFSIFHIKGTNVLLPKSVAN